jgi:hypothetical protein
MVAHAAPTTIRAATLGAAHPYSWGVRVRFESSTGGSQFMGKCG